MFNLTERFLQLALLGANWVLMILVALSIAAIAIVIERWIFYRGITGKDAGLVKPVNDALSHGDLARVRKLVQGAESAGARMLASMVDSAGKGVASISAIMTGVRSSEKIRLERNLAFLGTVGANAPFIGLFGTVLEILRVFNQLGEKGVTSGEQAKDIMTGISEALVATAIGLLVAIPAVIAYNAFQRKVKRLLSEADGLTNMALAQLGDMEEPGDEGQDEED
jgi:biopolymer transport protein ExbB